MIGIYNSSYVGNSKYAKKLKSLMYGMADYVPRSIPAAIIEENRSQLSEAIELSSLLPLLKSKGIPLPSILDTVDLADDFKSAALVRHVISSGQRVIDLFLETLHEDARLQRNALELLGKARLEYKKKYPVLQVLDDVRPSISNVAALVPYLMREGVLTTEHYHEVSSKYVSHDYQVGRVLMAVKARGIKGLSTFVKCLRRTDEYAVLAKILTEKGDVLLDMYLYVIMQMRAEIWFRLECLFLHFYV